MSVSVSKGGRTKDNASKAKDNRSNTTSNSSSSNASTGHATAASSTTTTVAAAETKQSRATATAASTSSLTSSPSSASSSSSATVSTPLTTATVTAPARAVTVSSSSGGSSASASSSSSKSSSSSPFYPSSYFAAGGDASLKRVYGGVPLPLNCVAEYFPRFIDEKERDTLYQTLLTTLSWENKGMSRDTILVGDQDVQYRYGRGYDEHQKPMMWTPELLALRDRIQRVTGCKMDVCLCGWYANGKKKIGWHRDREELGNSTPIASVSLGAERLFEFRENDATEVAASLLLEHGSLLIMGEHSQDRYLHALNPDAKVKTGRINLTFRCSSGVIQPPVYSTSAASASTITATTSSSPSAVSSPAVASAALTVVAKKAKSAAVIDDDD